MSLFKLSQAELIVFGYVRLNHKEDVPDDVTKICLEYYDSIGITWNVSCDNIKDCVTADGLQLNIESRNSYSTFAASNGWNKGIHYFALKQLSSKDYQFGIGIISSEALDIIKSNEKEDCFTRYKGKDIYAYALDAGICSLKNGIATDDMNCNPNLIGANDAVTVIVDCDEWKATFFINDQICSKSIDIEANKTYHAVISVWEFRDVTLRLIEPIMRIQTAIAERDRKDSESDRLIAPPYGCDTADEWTPFECETDDEWF